MTRRPNDYAVPLTNAHRKLLRESRTVTQATLAKQIGCSKQQISDMEWGRRNPSVHLLNRWCEALGLTCDVSTTVTIKRGDR